MLRIRVISVRIEQLLTIDLVVRNILLSFRRHQKVDELLPQVSLYIRMFGRTHKHDAVLIEHALIPFDLDCEITLALEVYPRPAIRQHVGAARGSGVECCSHTLADRFVPKAFVVLDVDPGIFPKLQFGDMCAGSVTTRNERSLVVLDTLHRLSDVLHSLDTGGISPRPDQHEVVVHHWIALCALAFG